MHGYKRPINCTRTGNGGRDSSKNSAVCLMELGIKRAKELEMPFIEVRGYIIGHPCAQQYVGKSQSCMVRHWAILSYAEDPEGALAWSIQTKQKGCL